MLEELQNQAVEGLTAAKKEKEASVIVEARVQQKDEEVK
jgi:hypothetical protein